tara:strand:+ start:10024 stop:11322 length:1299 start_codon:yes stop_codon:yes gene_type:complete
MVTATVELPFHREDGISRATRHIAESLRKQREIAVVLIGLDNIERICAAAGHLRTAELVDNFHTRLVRLCRTNDAVERIGDRKFVLMLDGLKNNGHITLAARKVERLVQEMHSDDKSLPALRADIGIALCPGQSTEPHELLRLAEVACLDGRRRNESPCFFEEHSARKLFEDWGLEKRLQQAIEGGDLELYYQPKMELATGQIVAAEALMRWHEPELGAVSPAVFIELAEATGQILDLTQFAIQTVCRMLHEWRESLPTLQLAVNISASLIQNRDIVEALRGALGIWHAEPARLTLEVTENALMDDTNASHNILTAIRELGCKVSIDDFGTGYSSLAYLKDIPADELKIDQTFVAGMLDDDKDRKIVEHTINIARSFELSVVAEGIESELVLDLLRDFQCDYAQGYFISKPLPATEFLEFVQTHNTAGKAAQ